MHNNPEIVTVEHAVKALATKTKNIFYGVVFVGIVALSWYAVFKSLHKEKTAHRAAFLFR